MDHTNTNPVGNPEQGCSGNPQAGMPALRNAGIPACGFWRHPCRQFQTLALLLVLALLALPAEGITFRWATSSQRIYVSGPGSATLSDIKAALPTAPLTLVDPTNMIWHLGADLFVETNAQLKLYGTSIGGDVNELRLKSENDFDPYAVVEIRADWGWLDIRSTKITSWDSDAEGPDTEMLVYGRAFLRARSTLDPDGVTAHESRMDIIDSDVGYLGSQNTEAYGLTWKVVDTTAQYIPPGSTNTLFDLVNVYGDIINSRLHHNWFGMYSYGHEGGQWTGNEVDNNVRYGFDPHDDSDNLVIENNNVHHNGWHGLIASKRCDNLIIRSNTVWANGKNGIMLHRHCNNSLIEGNNSHSNVDSGISIFDTDRTLIRNNICLSNGNAGIRFSVGAKENRVEDNEFGYSGKNGIYLYAGSDPPEADDEDPILSNRCRDNTFTNNFVHNYGTEALKVSNGDDNLFVANVFLGVTNTLRLDSATNTVFIGNTLPTNTLLKAIGSTTNQTSAFIMDQPRLNLQLDEYSIATFADTNGAAFAIFDFVGDSFPTTVMTTGSVATVTLTDLVATTTVLTRNLFLAPDAGSVFVTPTTWELTGDLEKAWTAYASNGTASIACTVGDLAPGNYYAVVGGTPAVALGTYAANGQGEISFAVSSAQLPLTDTNTFTVYPTNAPINTPPSLAALADATMVELATLTVTNTASDDNLPTNSLTYTLLEAPAGATIDTNGVIAWTPGETQGPGTNVFTTIVTDGELSVANSFTVVVTETNAAPTLLAMVDVEIVELTPLTVTNAASDLDFPTNTLTYLLLDAPTGAVIDTSGVITWTPDETQGPGTNIITTVVTDGELSETNFFTVIVTETNTAPTLPLLADVEIVELTTLTVTNTASDLDFPVSALTYSLVDAPAGATIDTNGVITWTPDETQGPGTNVITTVMTDGELSATNFFTVIVAETNAAPTLAVLADVEIVELTTLMVTNTASDTDFPVSALTYSLVDAPAGATIDTNGVITWMPDETQGLTTNVVTTVVTDGELSATNAFTVIVAETNAAPTLPVLADVEIIELTTLMVTNTAMDEDFPVSVLTYSLVDVPAGATIDTNGVITWAPDETQGPGTNVITTVVSDGELSATNAFTVIVTETNAAPTLPTLADVEMVELTTVTVTNMASDPDFPTNALSYTLVDAPVGVTIDTNGVITWTPDETQGPGTNVITTVVTDSELSTTNSFTVIVTETNAAPTLPVLADMEMVELTTLTVTNTANDTDFPTNTLSYALVDAPAGATIDTNGVITWTPDETQGPGTNVITTVVTDGELNATNAFTVIVTETNTTPKLPVLVDLEVVELTTLMVTNAASDTDFPASVLTYSLADAPAGATIDTNGVITWTPDEAQGPGTNVITTIVTDGELSATNSFTVVVTETNAAPTLPVLADVEIVELTTLTVTNTANDTDFPASVLTYSLVDAPAGATIDPNGVITWTPSGEQGPSTNLIVTVVTDGALSATNSFTVIVTSVAPVWLTIQVTAPDIAILSWPATSPGWVLQETVSLVPLNWTNTVLGGSFLTTGGGTNQVIVSPLDGNKFFRLFHP